VERTATFAIFPAFSKWKKKKAKIQGGHAIACLVARGPAMPAAIGSVGLLSIDNAIGAC